MVVALLHDRIPQSASKDELDTLVQVDSVSKALGELGYDPVPVEFFSDYDGFMETLRKLRPGFVFNLVESLRGRGQFICFAPLILDYLKIPYTGCPAEAVFLTSNKLLTKRIMALAGVPTPEWVSLDGTSGGSGELNGRYIVKSVWEEGSIGVAGEWVTRVKSAVELTDILKEKNEACEGSFYAERYIEGREFSVALLSADGVKDGTGKTGHPPQVLAPSEITFVGFPEGKPKIVDYRAKWETDSPEYRSTIRRFDFPEEEPILEELAALALTCWEIFELNGYARVDFRVDGQNRPFVLEINANPCISPDSGYVASAGKSGLNYQDLMRRIVGNQVRT